MSSPLHSSRGRTPSGRPNPIDVHVGTRMRLRRILLGLGQEQLGETLGLTFQQIQKYERGANRIGASRLFDIARALGVDIDYFYQDIGADLEAASPRHMVAATREPAWRPADTLTSRETIDLVRAYYRITDPAVRKRVHQLACVLAGAPEQADE